MRLRSAARQGNRFNGLVSLATEQFIESRTLLPLGRQVFDMTNPEWCTVTSGVAAFQVRISALRRGTMSLPESEWVLNSELKVNQQAPEALGRPSSGSLARLGYCEEGTSEVVLLKIEVDRRGFCLLCLHANCVTLLTGLMARMMWLTSAW